MANPARLTARRLARKGSLLAHDAKPQDCQSLTKIIGLLKL
jgi:hypothetical protein